MTSFFAPECTPSLDSRFDIKVLKSGTVCGARLITDEYTASRWLKKGWTGTHETVCHRTFEYARADVHVNTAESCHALIRRGLIGIYHNVSREFLHRYLWQFDFLWNNRQMNDGERTIAAIKTAEGKRLRNQDPEAERA